MKDQKIMTLYTILNEAGNSYQPCNASSLANGKFNIKLLVDEIPIDSTKVIVNK